MTLILIPMILGTYEEGGPPVEVADLISQSFPRYAVKEVEKRVTQVIKSLDKSVSSFVPFVSSSSRRVFALSLSCFRVDECSFSYLRVDECSSPPSESPGYKY